MGDSMRRLVRRRKRRVGYDFLIAAIAAVGVGCGGFTPGPASSFAVGVMCMALVYLIRDLADLAEAERILKLEEADPAHEFFRRP